MKKKILALVIAFLLPCSAFAAITAGTPSDGKSAVSGALTYSYTVSGSNVFLVVTVFGPTTDLCPSTITWNGTTLNLLGKQTGNRWEYMYGAPVSAATGNVVIACTGSDLAVSYAEEYDGVLSGTGASGANTGSATGASTFAIATTTIADNSWVVASDRASGGTTAAGSGTTLRYATVADANFALLDSGGAVTPAGSKTLNASNGGSVNWQGIEIILTPLIPPTPPPPGVKLIVNGLKMLINGTKFIIN